MFDIATEIQYFSDQHSESQRKLEINPAEITSRANRTVSDFIRLILPAASRRSVVADRFLHRSLARRALDRGYPTIPDEARALRQIRKGREEHVAEDKPETNGPVTQFRIKRSPHSLFPVPESSLGSFQSPPCRRGKAAPGRFLPSFGAAPGVHPKNTRSRAELLLKDYAVTHVLTGALLDHHRCLLWSYAILPCSDQAVNN